MKILSYELRGEKLAVQTDSLHLPEVVYRADKFKNLAALKKEIKKKIAEYERRKTLKKEKKSKLEKELKKELKIDDVDVVVAGDPSTWED